MNTVKLFRDQNMQQNPQQQQVHVSIDNNFNGKPNSSSSFIHENTSTIHSTEGKSVEHHNVLVGSECVNEKAVECTKATLIEMNNENEVLPYTKTFETNPPELRSIIKDYIYLLKKIREHTGVHIKFPTVEDYTNGTITISGEKKSVKQAKKQIKAVFQNIESLISDEITVNRAYHIFFLKRNSEVLSIITNECEGVLICFPRAGTDSDRVTLKGPKKCV